MAAARVELVERRRRAAEPNGIERAARASLRRWHARFDWAEEKEDVHQRRRADSEKSIPVADIRPPHGASSLVHGLFAGVGSLWP